MRECMYCWLIFESASNICPNCGYDTSLRNENTKIKVSAKEYIAQVSKAVNKYQKYFFILQSTWQEKPLLFGKREWEKKIIVIANVMYQLSCGKGIPEEFSKDVIMSGAPPKGCVSIFGYLALIRVNSKQLIDAINDLFDKRTSEADGKVGYHVDELIKNLYLLQHTLEESKN